MTVIRKVIGAIMVFLATGAYGFSMSSRLKHQLNELKELNKMLVLLKGEIECLKTPIPEALFRISKRLKEPVKTILVMVHEKYLHDERNALFTVWEQAWNEAGGMFHLSGKELEQIISFGACMGLADVNTQLAAIDLSIRDMEREIQELEEVVPKKSRLYRNMSILCGMMVVLILL